MRIELIVEEGDPPSGRVTSDDGRAAGFTGWLELLSALEALRRGAEAPAGSVTRNAVPS